jgi:hypothetical protein
MTHVLQGQAYLGKIGLDWFGFKLELKPQLPQTKNHVYFKNNNFDSLL